MRDKQLKGKLKQIKATSNKGFSLMEMLLVIFMFSVIIMGVQYTLIAAFRSVDDIKAYSVYQGAPERNFQFIKNTILRNQREKYTLNYFSIINSGEGMRMQIDDGSYSFTYAYIMRSSEEGREDELYYLVDTSPSRTKIEEKDIAAGKALLLAEDMQDIRFILGSDGLLTVEQVFLKGAHTDNPAEADQALVDVKELRLYVN